MRCLWLLFALLACACTDDARSPPAGMSRSAVQLIPVGPANQLDVLLVVDDSPAMATHREQTIASARALVAALTTLEGGLPDVHIGVVASDPARHGDLQVATATPLTGKFVSDVRQNDGSRVRNYTGTLRDIVAELVDLGAAGAAPQPLAMMKAALASNPTNAGFVRPEAFFAVVVVAAADDASPDGAETYAAAAKAIKSDPSRVLALTVRAGDTPRLDAFRAQFPNRSSDGDLTADPAAVYELFANAQVTTLGVPCWDSALLDVNATAAGLQTECTAELHTSEIDLAIVRCEPGDTLPCYSIRVDGTQCPSSGLRTELSNFEQFSEGTVRIECLVAQ